MIFNCYLLVLHNMADGFYLFLTLILYLKLQQQTPLIYIFFTRTNHPFLRRPYIIVTLQVLLLPMMTTPRNKKYIAY